MDEDVEAEKIRRLEERMKMFETGGAGILADVASGGQDDDSESSTSDGSSASDSE
jgi:hypothetical protein